jgi:hypothetical protein
MSESEDILEAAKAALLRIQEFDTNLLVRREELGKYAFDTAVEPAEKLVRLFQALSVNQLPHFPNVQLAQVKDTANSVFNIFQGIQRFDVENAQPSVADAQRAKVDSLNDHFQNSFNLLSPLIAFASARSLDFTALEREARASNQAALDDAKSILLSLTDQKDTAEKIIQEVRAAAAEQGVSKQAIHFKAEADNHSAAATIWLTRTIWTSIGLGIYAILSLFLQYVPGLEATDAYKAASLTVSKVLIFGVIAYMLFLCARNYSSHRHNEVVNRHRQNALATFTALAEATSDAASSDIVLGHAASCIFSPQETGYTKGGQQPTDSVPALQLIPRIGQLGGTTGS